MKPKKQSDLLNDGEFNTNKKETSGLSKYYRNCMVKIKTTLHLRSEDLNTEKIHNLRVEIKKVNALFHLLECSSSGFSRAKYFKPFKKLFRSAGKLRSLQVDFDLINRNFLNDHDPHYLHQLHANKIERYKKLSALIKEGISKRLLKNQKVVNQFAKNTSQHKIKSYFKIQEKYLSHLLEKNIFREERLHFIRKKLKRYYLNAKSMKAFNISHHWELLLDQLGEWHDHQVTVYQLTKAIHSNQLHLSEIKHLERLKSKIQHKKNELFEQIIHTYFETQSKRVNTKEHSEMIVHPNR